MAKSPSDRTYSQSHEWHKLDGDILTLGVTRFAVDALTDVTYVEMKKAGTKIKGGDTVGEVESVKTTSDIYSAAEGEIIEVNAALTDDPSLINTDPYGAGWLVKLRVTNKAGLDGLSKADAYDAQYPTK
ncbi:MAG: glycine cleavage system protein GcvH [Planctomycetota bacterium]